jgi:hypothetical protein
VIARPAALAAESFGSEADRLAALVRHWLEALR